MFRATLKVVAVLMALSICSCSNLSAVEAAEALPENSIDLRRAFNAGLARVIQNGKLKALRATWKISEVIMCHTCSADKNKMTFPDIKKVTGRLKSILKTKVIKVAGLKFKDLPSGDYTVDPPVGFWPEYMRAIVAEINQFYETDIAIKYNLFSTSDAIMDDLKSGKSDLTDQYMILSAFYGTENRIDAFSPACTAAAYESSYFTLASRKINSLDTLNEVIDQGPLRTVGFVSYSDYDVVDPSLTDNVQVVIVPDTEEMKQKVLNGELLAGLTSSRPASQDELSIFASGVVSPRGAMMLKDRVCVDAAWSSKVTILSVVTIAVVVMYLL